MIVASWRPDIAGLYKKADAQKCAEELNEIGKDITPSEVVEKAKDEGSELHKLFEWDDSVAATKYRLHQARRIIADIVIKVVDPKDSTKIIEPRMYYKVPDSTYKQAVEIIRNEDSYQSLLEQAKCELRAIKKRYEFISELKQIFGLID